MLAYENGKYVEIEEEAEMVIPNIPSAEGDALVEMATAMSSATTLAQMRAAAKTFLERTGGNDNESV
jgi:hypothetical protein